MVGIIIGILAYTAIGVITYMQIPAEDPEIIKARKEWGKASDE